jgi:hypothetical protein
VLALALREDDRNTRIALCAMANYCRINISRRASAQIKTRRKAMLMNLLLWYSQRTIPDGLYEDHESLIELLIRKANPDKFRAAFRVSREIFDALVRALSPFITDGKSKNSAQNVTAPVKLGIALYFMAHGMDGDVLGGAAGLERHTALKYLHQDVYVICSELSKDWIGDGIGTGNGTGIIMTPYTAIHGDTVDKQWFNLARSRCALSLSRALAARARARRGAKTFHSNRFNNL